MTAPIVPTRCGRAPDGDEGSERLAQFGGRGHSLAGRDLARPDFCPRGVCTWERAEPGTTLAYSGSSDCVALRSDVGLDEAVDATVRRGADIGVAVDRLLLKFLIRWDRRPLAADDGPPLAGPPIGFGPFAIGDVAAGETRARLLQALEPGAPILGMCGNDNCQQYRGGQQCSGEKSLEEESMKHGSRPENESSSQGDCASQ